MKLWIVKQIAQPFICVDRLSLSKGEYIFSIGLSTFKVTADSTVTALYCNFSSVSEEQSGVIKLVRDFSHFLQMFLELETCKYFTGY